MFQPRCFFSFYLSFFSFPFFMHDILYSVLIEKSFRNAIICQNFTTDTPVRHVLSLQHRITLSLHILVLPLETYLLCISHYELRVSYYDTCVQN